MHADLVARKEWIEREKEREKVEFPFKKGRGEGNKGEKEKVKINLLELNFSPKSLLWLKSGKEKGKNQYVRVALTSQHRLQATSALCHSIFLLIYAHWLDGFFQKKKKRKDNFILSSTVFGLMEVWPPGPSTSVVLAYACMLDFVSRGRFSGLLLIVTKMNW